MTRLLTVAGESQDGLTLQRLLPLIAKDISRNILSGSSPVTDDSSGTSSGVPWTIVGGGDDLVDQANSGGDLADTTTTAAALVTVQNGLTTLFNVVDTALGKLGFVVPSGNPPYGGLARRVTWSLGGTNGNGTVAAVTKSVTAQATGAASAGINAAIAQLDAAEFTLAKLVDLLRTASGGSDAKVRFPGVQSGPFATWDAAGTEPYVTGANVAKNQQFLATVPAYSATLGANSGTGALASAVDAKLTNYANDIATLAALINKCVGTFTNPQLVVSE